MQSNVSVINSSLKLKTSESKGPYGFFNFSGEQKEDFYL
jgi:hypothetical protein